MISRVIRILGRMQQEEEEEERGVVFYSEGSTPFAPLTARISLSWTMHEIFMYDPFLYILRFTTGLVLPLLLLLMMLLLTRLIFMCVIRVFLNSRTPPFLFVFCGFFSVSKFCTEIEGNYCQLRKLIVRGV